MRLLNSYGETECRVIRRKGWNKPMSKCPCDVDPGECPLYLIVTNHLRHLGWKLNFSLAIGGAILAAVVARFIVG